MSGDWIDLGPINEFPVGTPTLRKVEGQRFVCVREGNEVHALDDRCPHQGYPLSQGSLRDGVLTCEWHNWKFEVATGVCAFGGEPARRYLTRVEGGRVALDRTVDVKTEVPRLTGSLRDALRENEVSRALREGLRLGEILDVDPARPASLGGLEPAFAVMTRDGAARAPWGFDHGLALLSDLCTWVERGWVPGAEAFALAAGAIGEPNAHLGPRVSERHDVPNLAEPHRVAGDLAAERRADAETRVRSLVRAKGAELTVRQGLTPFVSRHIYDYGHGAIFLGKGLELARRFPDLAEDVLASVTVELGWATADTALPPFATTRGALERAATLNFEGLPRSELDRGPYEAEILEGERAAVTGTLARLERGCHPLELLRACGHAAAVRLGRFDRAWERKVEAEVTILDVTHIVTHAEAAITLAKDAEPRHAAALAILAAGFVGKLRRSDALRTGGSNRPPAFPPAAGVLEDAALARDLPRALAIALGKDQEARRAAYAELAPFAAFDAAVRPIFYAHTVKVLEALWRLDSADPDADGAYLEALIKYIVPTRREINPRRTAAVARKFLADGRPPEGLY
jgi:nitrite reductase/ring-hydroxylating ferredoxin subunit